jgi:hypothetical protein
MKHGKGSASARCLPQVLVLRPSACGYSEESGETLLPLSSMIQPGVSCFFRPPRCIDVSSSRFYSTEEKWAPPCATHLYPHSKTDQCLRLLQASISILSALHSVHDVSTSSLITPPVVPILSRLSESHQGLFLAQVHLLSTVMADFGAPLASRLPFTRTYTRFYAHYVGHWLGETSCRGRAVSSSSVKGVYLG